MKTSQQILKGGLYGLYGMMIDSKLSATLGLKTMIFGEAEKAKASTVATT